MSRIFSRADVTAWAVVDVNFRPAVLEPYVLWDVEQLYMRDGAESAKQ
jgi:hypothetical protein